MSPKLLETLPAEVSLPVRARTQEDIVPIIRGRRQPQRANRQRFLSQPMRTGEGLLRAREMDVPALTELLLLLRLQCQRVVSKKIRSLYQREGSRMTSNHVMYLLHLPRHRMLLPGHDVLVRANCQQISAPSSENKKQPSQILISNLGTQNSTCPVQHR